MTENADLSDRLERETDFHDHLYTTGVREQAVKYYSITKRSRNQYRQLLNELGYRKRVLEYGCGQGSYAFELAATGAMVTGIDISSVAIEQSTNEALAKGLSANVNFQVMNAEKMAFPDGSFDLVCGTSILHHLDLETSYYEILRVLKPGGFAVFSEPLGHNFFINWYRRRTPRLRTPDEHPLLASDLRLAQTIFSRADFYFYHCFELVAVPFNGTFFFRPACSLGSLFDMFLMRLIPPFRYWAWTVTMKLAK